MSSTTLAVLEQQTVRLAAARMAHRAAIIAAIDEGHSLRDIAHVAGVSHETIRRIKESTI